MFAFNTLLFYCHEKNYSQTPSNSKIICVAFFPSFAYFSLSFYACLLRFERKYLVYKYGAIIQIVETIYDKHQCLFFASCVFSSTLEYFHALRNPITISREIWGRVKNSVKSQYQDISRRENVILHS